MAKENKSRYAIMGMLALRAASGYQIKKMMEESTSNFWSESYGQIYPILKQLTRDGLATSQTEKQEGKPDSHIYTLTEQGTEELISWLGETVDEAPERIEILLKLFFGHLLPIETNIKHIQHFQQLQEKLLQKYKEIEAHLRQGIQECEPAEQREKYGLITVRFGIHRCQAFLAWCEETLEALREIAKKKSQDTTGS
ncbi:MAG TPA: PadR family transcriptional regulator [Ktedonobacteraceae bacterium]|nr:PadR family transcriptional regulator [Ktedonobacteraceae bacterium]